MNITVCAWHKIIVTNCMTRSFAWNVSSFSLPLSHTHTDAHTRHQQQPVMTTSDFRMASSASSWHSKYFPPRKRKVDLISTEYTSAPVHTHTRTSCFVCVRMCEILIVAREITRVQVWLENLTACHAWLRITQNYVRGGKRIFSHTARRRRRRLKQCVVARRAQTRSI